MNDDLLCGLGFAVLIAAMYSVYALTNPGGDGPVFAGACSAVVGIMTYIIGARKGYKTAMMVVRSPRGGD